MKFLGLASALLLIAVTALSRAGDKKASPLDEDHKKLQGTWEQVNPEKKGDVIRLSFTKDTLGITVRYADLATFKLLPVKFNLKETDKKRIVSYFDKENFEDGAAAFTYRFDGEKLIIEDGKCGKAQKRLLKGEWKRIDQAK